MIAARTGSGWQTTLADLSLILFMVTASAVSQQEEAAPVRTRQSPQPSAQAKPFAVWQAEAGAPPLADWLALQAPDAHQQLTLVVPYPPGGAEAALATTAGLLAQAGKPAESLRIVIEPGQGLPVARLAHDRPVPAPALLAPSSLARPLQPRPGPFATDE